MLERNTYNIKNRVHEDELSMEKKMDAFNTSSLEMVKTLQGIIAKNLNILEENESIKRFIFLGKDQQIGKE